MRAVFRNIAALVFGLVVGSAVNMGLVMLAPSVIPPPPGVDVMNPESIAASMHLFQPKHFLFPFLAHALGTLVGAAGAHVVAASHRTALAFAVGAAFFLGGIYASFVIPAPNWFIAADLLLAYFPMAWIGGRLAARLTAAGT